MNSVLIPNHKYIYNIVKQPNFIYKYVLLGESTHGTNEYYEIRSNITKSLIKNKNFNCIFLEMEWSLGYQVNRFIHSQINMSTKQFLRNTFKYYPKWMWCNEHIRKLLNYLKNYNRKNMNKIYVYGVDVQNIELAKENVCDDPTINCKIVKNIIENYDIMSGSSNYWDIRDTMWSKIIEENKQSFTENFKFVLWAHNSHIGNVKAHINSPNTLNIGYILIDKYENDVFNIGFTTYNGYVTATNKWGEKSKVMKIKNAHTNSYEHIFHNICESMNIDSILLISKTGKIKVPKKSFIYNLPPKPKYIRYIGVIYNKQNELDSHYSYTNIQHEFNLVIHIDNTSSIETFCE